MQKPGIRIKTRIHEGGISATLTGPGLNDFFAEKLIEVYGVEEARKRTVGPALQAVERVSRRMAGGCNG